ncbi:uncharacterized protein METZ01_LOCUS114396 [marine metagenome]|uniref:Baseplate tail tube cap n=1 Tax=marine metagenome TaxID=408172 RepID=A0A381XAG5_9ZZZZ
MQNFIAQSMRRMGLAPKNKSNPSGLTSHAGNNTVGNAPLSHMQVGSNWSYSTLEYPLDIQSRTDLGHYMMFYVNIPIESEYSKYNSMNKAESSGVVAGKEMPEYNQKIENDPKFKAMFEGGAYSEKAAFGASGISGDGKSWKPGQSNKVIQRKTHHGTAATVLGMKRTKRTSDSIVLYMPPQIINNTAALYKETELGGELGETAGRVKQLMSRADGLSIGTVAEGIRGFSGQMQRMMERGLAKVGSQIFGGDMLAAYDKISNRAMNQFLETMFTGVGFRKFSYTWKFTPKNPKESLEVQKIIKTFRFHMLPELPKDERFGRYYVVPAEFDIFYMFRGDENDYFNKLVTSVLVNMDVNYTPQQYQTFRPIDGHNGAPPVEIDMKLDFMETKLITKADVLEGY